MSPETKDTTKLAYGKDIAKFGKRYRDKFTNVTGKIVTRRGFALSGTKQHVMRLDEPLWTEGREIYISHIIIHPSNLVEIPDET
jgi:hypothetical protein